MTAFEPPLNFAEPSLTFAGRSLIASLLSIAFCLLGKRVDGSRAKQEPMHAGSTLMTMDEQFVSRPADFR